MRYPNGKRHIAPGMPTHLQVIEIGQSATEESRLGREASRRRDDIRQSLERDRFSEETGDPEATGACAHSDDHSPRFNREVDSDRDFSCGGECIG